VFSDRRDDGSDVSEDLRALEGAERGIDETLRVSVSRILPPCFLTVEMTDLMSAKICAPSRVRKGVLTKRLDQMSDLPFN
jgi:hypothetical protein